MELINEAQREVLPKTIANHKDWQIWGSCWHRVHLETKMVTIVHCGERGSGKSWNQLEIGDLLDRTIEDVPRFNMENMCFTPLKFKERLNGDYPRGTSICLDDAGIGLYSKESLARVVVEMGKTLQTIRRKYPIVQMSLPFFNILEKHARMFSDVYVEVMGRDTTFNQNIVKIHTLEKNYYTGDIYRYGLPKTTKKFNPEFGIEHDIVTPDFHRINKPRVVLSRPYDKLKMEQQDEWDVGSYERLASYENKELRKTTTSASFKDVLKYVRENKKDFLVEHGTGENKRMKVYTGKILDAFDGEERPTCSRNTAHYVARLVNEQ